MRPVPRSRAGAWLVALAAFCGVTVALYRNDLLLEGARRLGREAQFLALEQKVLGGPGAGTPRELRHLFQNAPAAAARPESSKAGVAVTAVAPPAAAPAAEVAAPAAEASASTPTPALPLEPPVQAKTEAVPASSPPPAEAAPIIRSAPRSARPALVAQKSSAPPRAKAQSADGIPVVTLEEDEDSSPSDAAPAEKPAAKVSKKKKAEAAAEEAPEPKENAAAPAPKEEAGPGLTGKSMLDAAIRSAASEISKKPKKKTEAEP